jgi:hypothetical protein
MALSKTTLSIMTIMYNETKYNETQHSDAQCNENIIALISMTLSTMTILKDTQYNETP